MAAPLSPVRFSLVSRHLYQAVIIIAGLAGLVLQSRVTCGIFASRGMGIGASFLKMASFFTILTNVLQVTAHAAWLVFPETKAGRFFARPSVQGGLLLYIGIVGLIYGALLARLWNPVGIPWWADAILHRVTPLLQFGFWIFHVPKIALRWSLAVAWLSYPAAYLCWALFFGSLGWGYPYPFINLPQLGLPRTLENCGWLTLAFLVVGLILIGSSRMVARHRATDIPAEGV